MPIVLSVDSDEKLTQNNAFISQNLNKKVNKNNYNGITGKEVIPDYNYSNGMIFSFNKLLDVFIPIKFSIFAIKNRENRLAAYGLFFEFGA